MRKAPIQRQRHPPYTSSSNPVRPSASLYPPLLADPDRALRQAGLYGVRTFRLKGSIPEVENLVTDLDETVAATAVESWGSFIPPKPGHSSWRSCQRRSSQFKAAQALRNYRDTEDMDAFVRRLGYPAAGDPKDGAFLAF